MSTEKFAMTLTLQEPFPEAEYPCYMALFPRLSLLYLSAQSNSASFRGRRSHYIAYFDQNLLVARSTLPYIHVVRRIMNHVKRWHIMQLRTSLIQISCYLYDLQLDIESVFDALQREPRRALISVIQALVELLSAASAALVSCLLQAPQELLKQRLQTGALCTTFKIMHVSTHTSCWRVLWRSRPAVSIHPRVSTLQARAHTRTQASTHASTQARTKTHTHTQASTPVSPPESQSSSAPPTA